MHGLENSRNAAGIERRGLHYACFRAFNIQRFWIARCFDWVKDDSQSALYAMPRKRCTRGFFCGRDHR